MTGRRVHERYHCVLDVTVLHEGSELSAKTDNLSLGGMYLTGTDHPPFGATVEVRFRLPGMKSDSTCAGTVRWIRGDGFGVQFSSLRPIDVWGLNQFFKTLTPME